MDHRVPERTTDWTPIHDINLQRQKTIADRLRERASLRRSVSVGHEYESAVGLSGAPSPSASSGGSSFHSWRFDDSLSEMASTTSHPNVHDREFKLKQKEAALKKAAQCARVEVTSVNKEKESLADELRIANLQISELERNVGVLAKELRVKGDQNDHDEDDEMSQWTSDSPQGPLEAALANLPIKDAKNVLRLMQDYEQVTIQKEAVEANLAFECKKVEVMEEQAKHYQTAFLDLQRKFVEANQHIKRASIGSSIGVDPFTFPPYLELLSSQAQAHAELAVTRRQLRESRRDASRFSFNCLMANHERKTGRSLYTASQREVAKLQSIIQQLCKDLEDSRRRCLNYQHEIVHLNDQIRILSLEVQSLKQGTASANMDECNVGNIRSRGLTIGNLECAEWSTTAQEVHDRQGEAAEKLVHNDHGWRVPSWLWAIVSVKLFIAGVFVGSWHSRNSPSSKDNP